MHDPRGRFTHVYDPAPPDDDDDVADACVCGRVFVGNHDSGSRNWNPDCPEHGTESEWWNSDEQREVRAAMNDRLRVLQRQAREARQKAVGEGRRS